MSTGDLKIGLEVFKGFSGKITQAALGFIGTIIFARVLGPTSFGAFYFLQSIVFIIDRPIKGTGTAIAKRMSEADASQQEIVGAGLSVAGLGSLLASGIVLLNSPLSSFTGVEDAGIVFFAIFAPVTFFFISQRMLEGLGLIGAKVWADTVRSALTLVAQLAFVLAGFGAAGMGYGLGVATVISAGVGLYLVGIRPRTPSREIIRSVWEYARYSIPQSFVGKIYGRVDTLALGILASTSYVSYYEVGLKLSIPATFLSGMVASALFPKISNLASGERDISTDTQNAISYTSIISIPILFGAISLPEKLVVTPYGPSYSPASPFLIGLVLIQVISSQVTVYISALKGMNHPDISLNINLIGLSVNVAVAIVAWLLVGPIGIVIGSVVAELTQYLIASRKVKQRVNVSRISRPLVEQIFSGVGMFVVLKVIRSFVPLKTFVHLGAVIGFGAAVYFALLYGISNSFRLTINSVLGDIVAEYN